MENLLVPIIYFRVAKNYLRVVGLISEHPCKLTVRWLEFFHHFEGMKPRKDGGFSMGELLVSGRVAIMNPMNQIECNEFICFSYRFSLIDTNFP